MAKFQIVAIAVSNGARTIMTAEPVTRAEAETMLSKMTQHKCRTLVIEEVPTSDDVEALRQQMVQDMHDQAALWRGLCFTCEDSTVFVGPHERLLWRVPGFGYACMQVSPNSSRPMVMAGTFTREQLEGARIVFDECPPGWPRSELKPQRFADYCELAAKGCESAAQYIEEMLQGGAQ